MSNRTIVCPPCLDNEPFELRPRMVRLPAPSQRLISTHTRLRLPEPARASVSIAEVAVSAATVFMVGCMILGLVL